MTVQIQYSVHPPTLFIQRFQHRLLPGWSVSISSVILILQHSSLDLQEDTIATQFHKSEMRRRFLDLGNAIATQLNQHNYLTDIFDPRTGMPVFSESGCVVLDDVAIAHACLGYPVCDRNGCAILLHPQWSSAVYPATLVSSAPVPVAEKITSRTMLYFADFSVHTTIPE